jgi:hypothetical protein
LFSITKIRGLYNFFFISRRNKIKDISVDIYQNHHNRDIKNQEKYNIQTEIFKKNNTIYQNFTIILETSHHDTTRENISVKTI